MRVVGRRHIGVVTQPTCAFPVRVLRVFRIRKGVRADVGVVRVTDDAGMSYAVLWSEQEGPAHAGKLELSAGSLVLDGVNGSGRIRREFSIGDVMSLRIGRARGERLGGRPALMLQLTEGRTLRLATLAGVGALHEVVDHISGRDHRRNGVTGMRPLASR